MGAVHRRYGHVREHTGWLAGPRATGLRDTASPKDGHRLRLGRAPAGASRRGTPRRTRRGTASADARQLVPLPDRLGRRAAACADRAGRRAHAAHAARRPRCRRRSTAAPALTYTAGLDRDRARPRARVGGRRACGELDRGAVPPRGHAEGAASTASSGRDASGHSIPHAERRRDRARHEPRGDPADRPPRRAVAGTLRERQRQRRRDADRARAHARRHGGGEDRDPRLDGRRAGGLGRRAAARVAPAVRLPGRGGDRARRGRPRRARCGSGWTRDTVRQPAAGLVHGLRTILLSHGLVDVRMPSLGRQAAGLLAPARHRRAGAVHRPRHRGRHARRVAPRHAVGARPARRACRPARMGKVGNAVQALVLAYEAGPAFESPASSYLLSSDRVIRGWTLQLLLLALVVPAVLPLLDLVARGTRRGIPLAAALRDLAAPARRAARRARGAARRGARSAPCPACTPPPFPGDGAGVSLWRPGARAGRGDRRLAARAAAARRRPMRGIRRRRASRATSRRSSARCVAAGLALLGNPYALVLALPALHLWLVLPSLARLGLDGAAQRRRARLDRPRAARRGARRPGLARRLGAALGRAPARGRGAAARRHALARDAVRGDLPARRDRERPLRQRQHVDELAGRSVRRPPAGTSASASASAARPS